MQIGPGIPSPTTILFNRPILDLLPRVHRLPITCYYCEDHYNALKLRQCKLIKKNDTIKEHTITPTESTVTVQREDSGPWMHKTIIEHGDEEQNANPT